MIAGSFTMVVYAALAWTMWRERRSAGAGPVARVAFAAALVGGNHVERPDVLVVRGREITLSGDPVDLDADGEVEREVRARTWRVQPGAWSTLVPA